MYLHKVFATSTKRTIPAKFLHKWMVAAILLLPLFYVLYAWGTFDAFDLSDVLYGEWMTKGLTWKTDLHHLPNNDAFIPYFAKLPEIRSMSLARAAKPCSFRGKELQQFQFGWESPWLLNPPTQTEINIVRSEWQAFVLGSLVPWSSVRSRFSGRGIVIVAGHPKAIIRVKVILRALLKHKSIVPVEINYYGQEMTSAARESLRAIYGSKLFFNDLSDSNQVWPTLDYDDFTNLNYQLKTAALVNTRFLEPLLLDSDNVPASDPAVLWESQEYKEYGAVFWPDYTRTREQHPAWAITNTLCRREEYEFESGQVLVDKRRVFYHLQLAAWMITQEYWRVNLLGDKDVFRYAWHALKTGYGRPQKWLTSIGFMAEQRDEKNSNSGNSTRLQYCGHTFAQHHPDFSDSSGISGSGIAFLHGGTLKTLDAPLLARLRANKGGIYTHYKRSKLDENWRKIEYNMGLRFFDTGFYYNLTKSQKPETLVVDGEDLNADGNLMQVNDIATKLALTDDDFKNKAMCVDMDDVEARPLTDFGEEGLQFERLFEQSGGYWMIEDGYRKLKSGS